ncbi:MAG: hypothetical protein KGY80_08570 [Candidatus Thorarchaeota archaeon]|nr:hypothetical protein [Candidatus Thorarchaeota archaeon]
MEISDGVPSDYMGKVTLIAELKPDSHNVDIIFRVVKIFQERKIVSAHTGRHHHLSEIVIADSTAKILFVLWDNIVKMECDQVFLLRNAKIRVYDCSMRVLKTQRSVLSLSSDTPLKINLQKDMSKPFAWKNTEKGVDRAARTFSGEKTPEEKGYCSWKEF